MDLRSLDTKKNANAGVEYELKHPDTGEGLGIVLFLLGQDSDAYQAETRRQHEKMLRQAQKTRNLAAINSEDRALEMLAVCVAGWDGLEMDGKPLDHTPANALTVLRDFPWIREQVDRTVHDRGFFLRN